MSGNLLARSVHDLSAATWFGGSLMGAIGLNGAASKAANTTERTLLSSYGWKKWAPVQAAAFGAHLASLGPILADNKARYAGQEGVMKWSWIKAGVTVTGAALTLYAGLLGRKVGQLAEEGAEGATQPGPSSSPELAKAQNQLKFLQWIIPVFAGAVVVLGALHGEMQRPKNVKLGFLQRLHLGA